MASTKVLIQLHLETCISEKIDHAMLYTSYKKTVGTLSVTFPFTPHTLPPILTPTPTLLPLGFDVQPFFVLSPLSCCFYRVASFGKLAFIPVQGQPSWGKPLRFFFAVSLFPFCFDFFSQLNCSFISK